MCLRRGVSDARRLAGEARGLEQALLDWIRAEVRGQEPPLHLVVARAAWLSLLLGDVWDRMSRPSSMTTSARRQLRAHLPPRRVKGRDRFFRQRRR